MLFAINLLSHWACCSSVTEIRTLLCCKLSLDTRSAPSLVQGLSLQVLRRLLDPPPAVEKHDAGLERELWAALPPGCRGAWEGRPPPSSEVCVAVRCIRGTVGAERLHSHRRVVQ
jgi:hypothetical protein